MIVEMALKGLLLLMQVHANTSGIFCSSLPQNLVWSIWTKKRLHLLHPQVLPRPKLGLQSAHIRKWVPCSGCHSVRTCRWSMVPRTQSETVPTMCHCWQLVPGNAHGVASSYLEIMCDLETLDYLVRQSKWTTQLDFARTSDCRIHTNLMKITRYKTCCALEIPQKNTRTPVSNFTVYDIFIFWKINPESVSH